MTMKAVFVYESGAEQDVHPEDVRIIHIGRQKLLLKHLSVSLAGTEIHAGLYPVAITTTDGVRHEMNPDPTHGHVMKLKIVSVK